MSVDHHAASSPEARPVRTLELEARSEPFAPEPPAAGLLPATLGVTVLCFGLRSMLLAWLAPRAPRTVPDPASALTRVVTRIQHLEAVSDVMAAACEELADALQLETALVFYRRRGASDFVAAGPLPGEEGERIPADWKLLLSAGEDDRPRMVATPPLTELPIYELALLERIGAQVVVPLHDRDRQLFGLLCAGGKRSGDPWTAGELQSLRLIAGNIMLVVEPILRAAAGAEIRRSLPEGQDRLLAECLACGRCYDGSARICPYDGNELDRILEIERTLKGRYRLDRHLERGGMGDVYQGHDIDLDRTVAIKILVGENYTDLLNQKRFQREAMALARLNHPSIVSIHDFGRSGTACAFIVMELVPGDTLRTMLRERGTLEGAEIAALFDQILVAVYAAHQEGVVHRDLKPENVLILQQVEPARPLVKVLDFGLARLMEPGALEAATLTPVGAVFASPYAAPELRVGDPADARADIFSLGVMVIEAFTGRRPFKDLGEILNVGYHLPAGAPEHATLDAALQRCIAPEPSARYRSVKEMQQAVIPALLSCPPLGVGAVSSG